MNSALSRVARLSLFSLALLQVDDGAQAAWKQLEFKHLEFIYETDIHGRSTSSHAISQRIRGNGNMLFHIDDECPTGRATWDYLGIEYAKSRTLVQPIDCSGVESDGDKVTIKGTAQSHWRVDGSKWILTGKITGERRTIEPATQRWLNEQIDVTQDVHIMVSGSGCQVIKYLSSTRERISSNFYKMKSRLVEVRSTPRTTCHFR